MKTMTKPKKTEAHTAIPADDAKTEIDAEAVLRRNQALENASLDNFLIRLPRLKIHTHFYYKFVESGECSIGDHGHWHWEITRICNGRAAYTIPSLTQSFLPDSDHYLVIPPRMTHSWRTNQVPILMHSWQVRIDPEDSEGKKAIEALEKSVSDKGFLIAASTNQIEAEKLLWDMASEEVPPQIFGSILSGFARIVIGNFLAKLNPWPAHLLTDRQAPHLAVESLANRIRSFLDENIENPITLNDLEGHFHYSERHLNRIFQKVHHISIGQYLRRQRLDLAKRWLETTDRPIKNIAFSLGYNAPGQFCRYFAAQVGLSPTAYRNQKLSLSAEQVRQSVSKSHPKQKNTP